MACAERAGCLAVEVAYCPAPGQADLVALELPPGSTLGDALRASGLLERHRLDEAALRTGIWSREQPLDTPLRAGDRVELYRALQVDPQEARRRRHRRQLHQRAANARGPAL